MLRLLAVARACIEGMLQSKDASKARHVAVSYTDLLLGLLTSKCGAPMSLAHPIKVLEAANVMQTAGYSKKLS